MQLALATFYNAFVTAISLLGMLISCNTFYNIVIGQFQTDEDGLHIFVIFNVFP